MSHSNNKSIGDLREGVTKSPIDMKYCIKLLALNASFLCFILTTVCAAEKVFVRGYTKKDGTVVQGYYRNARGSDPSSANDNDLSTTRTPNNTTTARDILKIIELRKSYPAAPLKPRSEYDKAMDVFRRQRGDKIPEEPVKHKEAYYQKIWCNQNGGVMEVVIPNGRIDCLTATHAVEVDFMKKWAESIGQSLFYAKTTGKKPGILLIINPQKDTEKLNNIQKTIESSGIDLWTITNDASP